MSKPPSRLIVSVDLGTTYTGVAYCFVTEGDQEDAIDMINAWPGLGTTHLLRVPTLLYYDTSQKVVGWGFDVANAFNETGCPKDGVLKCEWFNLFREMDNYSLSMANLPPLPPGKSGMDLVADYLFHLVTAIRSDLHFQFKSVYTQMESHIEWCFTVPPLAGDGLKTGCKRAIVQAGFVQGDDEQCPTFIDGQEACLFMASKTGLLVPHLHGAFLMVNCGAVMVDLMAFETVNERDFEFRKLKHTGGDSCG
jgi:hypothetical protein